MGLLPHSALSFYLKISTQQHPPPPFLGLVESNHTKQPRVNIFGVELRVRFLYVHFQSSLTLPPLSLYRGRMVKLFVLQLSSMLPHLFLGRVNRKILNNHLNVLALSYSKNIVHLPLPSTMWYFLKSSKSPSPIFLKGYFQKCGYFESIGK